MTTNTEHPAHKQSTWVRGLYMVLFSFFLWVAKFVAGVVIVVQFFFVLFTGSTNDKLLSFGQSLSTYQYEVLLFLTFNSEEHPYPMSDWPAGPPDSKF